MFDFRFHLVSLTAIFLALGLGIVIGIAVIDGEALEREQKYLIESLETDFRYLREQNALSKKEIAEQQKKLELWQNFSQDTLPFIIKGKLSGKKIALIKTGDQEFPPGLVENLLNAGAEITSQFDVDYLFQTEENVSKYQQRKDLITELKLQAALIAEQICVGDLSLTEEAEAEEVLVNTPWQPPEVAILIGGANYKDKFLVEQFDLPLISYLREYGLMVAGTEVSGTFYSYIPQYLKGADIIIDQIETIPGQVALIWALTGFTGYYGSGSNAAGLLPKISNSVN